MEDLASLVGRTLVIVAHPDDESVGCGGLLQRVREPMVVFCTDGAPRDKYFWGKYGSRENYARIRRGEALRALAHVGVTRMQFLAPEEDTAHPFVDQDLFLHIPEALRELSKTIAEFHPDALLTLPYEGGHPDHDTCSFLTWWLSREHAITAWEMPMYHRAPDGSIQFQRFVVPEGGEVLFDGTLEEIDRKRAMCAEYVSQGDIVSKFNLAVERFRPQPAYDYSRPPHPGVLNYEAWQWPITGTQLVESFRCCIDKHLHSGETPLHPSSTVRGLA